MDYVPVLTLFSAGNFSAWTISNIERSPQCLQMNRKFYDIGWIKVKKKQFRKIALNERVEIYLNTMGSMNSNASCEWVMNWHAPYIGRGRRGDFVKTHVKMNRISTEIRLLPNIEQFKIFEMNIGVSLQNLKKTLLTTSKLDLKVNWLVCNWTIRWEIWNSYNNTTYRCTCQTSILFRAKLDTANSERQANNEQSWALIY